MLHQGDCLKVLPTLPESSVDAIVTDPPYGLEFMGKEWDGANGFRRSLNENDTGRNNVFGRTSKKSPEYKSTSIYQEWCRTWAIECLRVLKPAHYMLAFGGTRTHHRLACAIEDAGFEIRDCLMWVYGCLSDDTEILVDGQWEPYHKAIEGRLALCYDAEHDAYQWQPIQGLHVYDYCDTAYRIQSDRTDQIVSRNHRCLVEQGGGYAFQYAEALEREARVPILEDVQGLLGSLSLPHQRTSSQKSSMWPGVCCKESFDTEEGKAAGPALQVAQQKVLALQEARRDSGLLGKEESSNLLQSLLSSEGACQEPAAVLCEREGKTQARNRACRKQESSVEGRRHLLQDPRQLQGREVCSLPGAVSADGSQGRLRDGASAFCCPGDGPVPASRRSGSSRQPQASRQPADQPSALCEQPRPQAIRASRFTCADLARVTPIHYQGIVWCVTVPTGAFVCRRNGKVFVTGNSGFPKGKGCLKPAYEPVLLARKPGPKVMPLQIDACRVPTFAPGYERLSSRADTPRDDIRGGRLHACNGGKRKMVDSGMSPSGRWPANVIHDGSEEVLAEFAKAGSVARFFYCAKASRTDRNEGCEGMPRRMSANAVDRDSQRNGNEASPGRGSRSGPRENFHPTVKPTPLLRYLCRLITPPGGTVLDPFMGSGSTGKAARLEGFEFQGIEIDATYFAIAQKRIAAETENKATQFNLE